MKDNKSFEFVDITDNNKEDEKFNEFMKIKNKKRKKSFAGKASVIAAVFFALSVFTLFFFFGKRSVPVISAADPEENVEEVSAISFYVAENEEMRGIWVPTYANITYPSETGLSESALKAELDEIARFSAQEGFNAIFFQVRPCEDALYNSDIFPSSAYVSGTQGIKPENDFDSLDYLIKEAGRYGIKVHAWVNPFRIANSDDEMKKLSSGNIAVLHPEYTVRYADNHTYLNPGIPEARQYVVDGVKELVEKYPELAGIIFDDYFYPYPVSGGEYNDAAQYAAYGNGMDKAAWRRENVNSFIKASYEAVKSANPNAVFGVSPFGIWANADSGAYVQGSDSSGLESYFEIYTDTLAWIDGGYVDYIAPQLYWSFATSSAPFDNLARWWNKMLDGKDVDHYFGMAAYKADSYPKNEIGIQTEFSRTLLNYKGSIYYGYNEIKANVSGVGDKIRELNERAVTYPDREAKKLSVYLPQDNTTSSSQNITVVGESDVNYPLNINGERISRTKSGYFSYYAKLTSGINVLTLEQNGKTVTHNIKYNVKKNEGASEPVLLKNKITEIEPSKETWLKVGDTLKISCVAPTGSKVTAKIGGMSVELKSERYSRPGMLYEAEIFTGEITPSKFVNDDEIAVLGTLVINAVSDGRTITENGGLIKQMGEKALVYAEVVNDYSHLKISPSSSFYDDYTPVNKGMRDYISGREGSYYKLNFGAYISESDIEITEGRELNKNLISSVDVIVSGTDTSNNKNNFTDVVFDCYENAPVTSVVKDGVIELTFYNTDTSIVPKANVNPNPVVSAVSAQTLKDDKVKYAITLKNEFNFYGYDIIYKDGKIILRLKNPQSLSDAQSGVLTGKTIIIDAGHGGKDTGALGCGKLNEADINLSIALLLKEELVNLGANVVMTREADTTFELTDRITYLAASDPDLEISIHQNSMDQTSNVQKIRGFLGLYSADAGKALAKVVSSTVCSELNRYERPYAYQKLAVARNHRFPSTLCEMCFISNVEEYEWSLSDENVKRSAKALADGIVEYYKAQEAYLEY
ncbi:MAG: family 10 glycosylhydrolase [Clostridia bacterium]|nr:family 10 glycosylhydrolase [Clostridia bacterium]